jgi:hypothetical protein
VVELSSEHRHHPVATAVKQLTTSLLFKYLQIQVKNRKFFFDSAVNIIR